MLKTPRLLLLLTLGVSLASGADVPAAKNKEATPIFSRAQLKYGLGRTDYTHRWVDRPLMVNPQLADPENRSPSRLAPASFLKTQETVLQYGLTGLAFFPEVFQDPKGVFFQLEKERVSDFKILCDFTSATNDEVKIRLAGEALANPASFRIDGKVVIVSYLAGQHPPQYWRDLLGKIREAHGDYFVFLPAIDWFDGKTVTHWIPAFHEGSITDHDEAAIKEGLREWVRATDGLYSASAATFKKDHQFDEVFYRGFVIRYMKEVLSEPEFSGRKYLGLSACSGHENCTRFGYTLSSDGSATLRRSLEAALDARPDVIVIPEWDEQNENTSLRPTVYNGKSMMRLLRHYAAQERRVLQEPLPGDDLSVPNLIISFRKILTLGEPLTLELLSIPERGVEGPAKVKVDLENDQGTVVYSMPEINVAAGRLWLHRLEIPSERFAASRYLVPVVKVSDSKGERTFSEGMQVIDLRASWNWDYKWVMQPLRELLVPERCRFEQVTESTPEEGWVAKLQTRAKPQPGKEQKMIELSAKLEAKEPLAYVEILDNDDVIYSHQLSDPMPRENADTVVFRIGWQSLEWKAYGRPLSGTISLKGAKGHWLTNHQIKQEGQSISLEGEISSIWEERILLSFDRKDLAGATLEIDLPDIWQGTLPLEKVYQSGIFGIPGPVGLNFVVSRYLRQDAMPEQLNVNAVTFTIPVMADLPRSRLNLQAIAVSGKIYRSRPLIVGHSAQTPLPLMVYSSAEKQPVKVEVDASMLPDLRYRFEPETTGSVLVTDAGRPFWAILGGFSSQATGRGGGESRDGTPFLKPGDYPALITTSLPRDYAHDKASETRKADVPSAPAWKKLPSGEFSLVFNGESTFLTLPQGAIPRLASYEVTMDLKPRHTDGKQLLLSHRSFYQGSLSILSDNGHITVSYLNSKAVEQAVDSGLTLQASEWNTLKVGYDMGQISFTFNGEKSGPFPLSGPGLYETVTVVGGYGEEWYAGEMKALQIRHGAPRE